MSLLTTLKIHDFKYRVSYRTLFSWPRQLQVYSGTLDPIAEIALPPMLAESQGFLLRAIPVQVEPRLAAGQDSGLLRYVLQEFPRYYIDMAGMDFDGYKAQFSGKTRSTIQRKVKKFVEHCGGSLRWQTYRSPEEIRAFWSLARAISSKTYQERLLQAGLPDDAQYQRQAEAWAANDGLRAYLLFDGDRPVSYLFCPIRDGVIDYAFLGYDPEYQRHSVGTVLQWLALESLFAERRYRFFDFTEGESDHKRLFATGHLDCAHIAMLRPTWANRFLVRSHQGFNRAVEALGRWLERKQLKSRIQRLLRGGAA